MRKGKKITQPPEDYTPLSDEERREKLLRVRDKLLSQIERGAISASERTQLIKSYEGIERILNQAQEFSKEEVLLREARAILAEIPSAF